MGAVQNRFPALPDALLSARDMIKLQPVLFVLGLIICALGVAMGAVGAFDYVVDGLETSQFIGCAAITLFAGGALCLASRGPITGFNHRQAFILTVLSWVVGCAFAALPIAVTQNVSYAGAYFETMSGLTTTGSSVLVGLDTMPVGTLLWRSLLQWMGGVGIIVLAIAILPFLRVGGMQLFKSESSDKSEKVLPRASELASATIRIYLLLTVVCALFYFAAGMNGFDAVAHAMTTLSTGGYSTSDASFGNWGDPAIHWIAVIFMFLGGLPFVLFVKISQGNFAALFKDSQVRAFVGIIAVTAAAIAVWLVFTKHLDGEVAVRLAVFNVVSLITTTGFALGDYNLWGGFPLIVVFMLMFIGGTSGSTAGGIKVFRLQIIAIAMRMQVQRMIHPHAVLPRTYAETRLSDELIASVVIFANVYILTVVMIALGVAATGADFITALTGAATAVGNVGPGIGAVIGPASNFSTLSDTALWFLSLGMLLGRLELMTFFIMLMPAFWRD